MASLGPTTCSLAINFDFRRMRTQRLCSPARQTSAGIGAGVGVWCAFALPPSRCARPQMLRQEGRDTCLCTGGQGGRPVAAAAGSFEPSPSPSPPTHAPRAPGQGMAPRQSRGSGDFAASPHFFFPARPCDTWGCGGGEGKEHLCSTDRASGVVRAPASCANRLHARSGGTDNTCRGRGTSVGVKGDANLKGGARNFTGNRGRSAGLAFRPGADSGK